MGKGDVIARRADKIPVGTETPGHRDARGTNVSVGDDRTDDMQAGLRADGADADPPGKGVGAGERLRCPVQQCHVGGQPRITQRAGGDLGGVQVGNLP